MAKFEVLIKETLERVVEVEAESPEEAIDIINNQWKAGGQVLNADDFTDVEFTLFKNL